MNVLGISALYHDAAAAVCIDGQLVAAAQEERFSRRKQDRTVPWRAARSCLDVSGLSIADIDCLAYYEEPSLKLDRQLSMLAAEVRPEPAAELLARIDPTRVYRAMREGLGYDGPVRFMPHHLSHAASAYFFSGFAESAVLVLDAVGEWTTSSYGTGSPGSGIRLVESDRFPHSLGLFYSTVTAYLGFEVNEGEYKTMGLAPLGRPTFVEQLRKTISWTETGEVTLDTAYFDFTGLRRMWSDALPGLLGIPPRETGQPLDGCHADLARSVQLLLEEVVLAKARAARAATGARNLCMAGGVALNCVAVGRLRAAGLFDDIFVQPAAGDAGGAIGAAAQASYDLGTPPPVERLAHTYLGPGFSTARDVVPALRAAGLPYVDHGDDLDGMFQDVVRRLAAGQIIGWFQGRMEFGPRALGNRSILADPRRPDMRDRINALVKMREAFRPFAPSALDKLASRYFDCPGDLPFMLETVRARTDTLPAVTHVDGSARLQTVSPETNPRFAELLERYASATGCGVLLNTSFNQRGEPIVCSPVDAIACFARSGLDALVIGEVVVDGREVPDSWRTAVSAKGITSAHSDEPGVDHELAVYELA
ncbi:carbamoyltransferase [Polymorphospora lycopeni]|uniref:Carbamoyltransferase C-terminal domain-containing protein n=1 Tax=Polymorphospora lycopeni TaxID=3140240 RepID=A0ABV5CQD9_9ACTN